MMPNSVKPSKPRIAPFLALALAALLVSARLPAAPQGAEDGATITPNYKDARPEERR